MLVLAKAMLALMIGFIASVVLGLVFIPWLRKLKVGQKTSVFVKAHEKKSGTPTMGGIMIIIAIAIKLDSEGKVIFSQPRILTGTTRIKYSCSIAINKFNR